METVLWTDVLVLLLGASCEGGPSELLDSTDLRAKRKRRRVRGWMSGCFAFIGESCAPRVLMYPLCCLLLQGDHL